MQFPMYASLQLCLPIFRPFDITMAAILYLTNPIIHYPLFSVPRHSAYRYFYRDILFR